MTLAATNITFMTGKMWVDLTDGRTLGLPVSWFPLLDEATPAQRRVFHFTTEGIYWPELNQDLLVRDLLSGNPETVSRGAVG